MRCLSGERQGEVGVAAARRVIMDADTIEACVLATRDERCEVGQGPADRNSKGELRTTFVPASPNVDEATKPPSSRVMRMASFAADESGSASRTRSSIHMLTCCALRFLVSRSEYPRTGDKTDGVCRCARSTC